MLQAIIKHYSSLMSVKFLCLYLNWNLWRLSKSLQKYAITLCNSYKSKKYMVTNFCLKNLIIFLHKLKPIILNRYWEEGKKKSTSHFYSRSHLETKTSLLIMIYTYVKKGEPRNFFQEESKVLPTTTIFMFWCGCALIYKCTLLRINLLFSRYCNWILLYLLIMQWYANYLFCIICRLKHFIGVGVGAGANVLSRFAVSFKLHIINNVYFIWIYLYYCMV